jgi:hypothetical protein
MKKTLLLGTTALMAAGFAVSGVAQAAEEPITVGINGYFVSAIGTVSQENDDGDLADDQNSFQMANNMELTLGGSTTLDNGITAGFSSQLNGNNGGDTFDERFVYFSGSFGMLRMGQTEDARQKMMTTAPGAAGTFGINSPFFRMGVKGGPLTLSTVSDGLGSDDALKVLYFSPNFNGFRVGMSYASTMGANGFYGTDAGDANGGLQNGASVGLEFNNDFGDVALRVSGGLETYKLETCAGTVGANAVIQNCDNNPGSSNFGAKVSFGDFAVGGSFMTVNQVAASTDGTNLDREDYDLGVSWGSGPLSMALLYGETEFDIADDTTDSWSVIEVNAQYVIGPGIELAAAVTRGDFDDATQDIDGGLDNSYTEVKASAALWF